MTARAGNVKHSRLIDNPIVFERSYYKHLSACFSSSHPSLNETHVGLNPNDGEKESRILIVEEKLALVIMQVRNFKDPG